MVEQRTQTISRGGVEVVFKQTMWDHREDWITTGICVNTPGGKTHEFSKREATEAKSLAELTYRFDESEFLPQSDIHIPLAVAVDGRPAIATYLHLIQGKSLKEVSAKLDVAYSTVRKYVREFGEHVV